MATWTCKIGEVDRDSLPAGCDGPMRQAVDDAYENLTGKQADFIFSGWGGKLNEYERAVVEDREPVVTELKATPCGWDWEVFIAGFVVGILVNAILYFMIVG